MEAKAREGSRAGGCLAQKSWARCWTSSYCLCSYQHLVQKGVEIVVGQHVKLDGSGSHTGQ